MVYAPVIVLRQPLKALYWPQRVRTFGPVITLPHPTQKVYSYKHMFLVCVWVWFLFARVLDLLCVS